MLCIPRICAGPIVAKVSDAATTLVSKVVNPSQRNLSAMMCKFVIILAVKNAIYTNKIK